MYSAPNIDLWLGLLFHSDVQPGFTEDIFAVNAFRFFEPIRLGSVFFVYLGFGHVDVVWPGNMLGV